MDIEELKLDALLEEINLGKILQIFVRDHWSDIEGFRDGPQKCGPCQCGHAPHGHSKGEYCHLLVNIFEEFQELVESRMQVELGAIGWTRAQLSEALLRNSLNEHLIIADTITNIDAFADLLFREMEHHDQIAVETKDLW